MRITKIFHTFFESERSGGIVLLGATIFSLLIANSFFNEMYSAFWATEIGGESILSWVNDALMAIFFLLIGLELEREIYIGELSDIKKAAMPIIGAIGGMIVPAVIYFSVNAGLPSAHGWGIPMATDIAFAVGILSMLGNRVPTSLKVFLTALAVIDDLGAILVIAAFYTEKISWMNLGISLSLFAFLCLLNRLKVRNLIPYIIGGIAMWYFMHHSGIHATITGVLLAFALPFGNGDEKSTSYLLQQALHVPVAFFILPLFALANTDIQLGEHWLQGIIHPVGLGIIAGLVVGKPVGIWLFSYLSAKIGFCKLPLGLKWKHIFGVGMLAGIGFTMSIFITLLAFDEAEFIASAKICILIASLISGILGYIVLGRMLTKNRKKKKTVTA
ncbi:Na+/H+ antiporter NhaA [Flavobacterium silvaticum]|uniref:Na(+)/H(+) antiporter NhaA n=1 Tax=Flavobacterium silvaticum TaxID=1852020 RepID=A0A972FP04_9FLAO|nr:Na+/H+ antiporter NhaA [Flavobacterium silvaticum]NMH29192.1 Na+/H+ antiporter NhaA [Flavobacterium silvaticum]